ncbi:MAG: hypothetical protein Edafosvirus35_2 [Edafosvirus sp.]|uniref:Uncharacterized protein n=1 Tax=Edafosvirus sp. TaxID=2487765 RepID=A0A3G4ZV88_9VIRU|nr:MAG: hypothetical protein Edafosvirus35_2 [Edafosvirus sp.]
MASMSVDMETYETKTKFLENLSLELIKNPLDLHKSLTDVPIKNLIVHWAESGWLRHDTNWKTILKENLHLLKDKPSSALSYLPDLILIGNKLELIPELVVYAQLEIEKIGSPLENIELLKTYAKYFHSTGTYFPTVLPFLEQCIECKNTDLYDITMRSICWGFGWYISQFHGQVHKINFDENDRETTSLPKLTIKQVRMIVEYSHRSTSRIFQQQILCDLCTRLNISELKRLFDEKVIEPPNGKHENKEMVCISKTCPIHAYSMGELMNFGYQTKLAHVAHQCECYCECSKCYYKVCSEYSVEIGQKSW